MNLFGIQITKAPLSKDASSIRDLQENMRNKNYTSVTQSILT